MQLAMLQTRYFNDLTKAKTGDTATVTGQHIMFSLTQA